MTGLVWAVETVELAKQYFYTALTPDHSRAESWEALHSCIALKLPSQGQIPRAVEPGDKRGNKRNGRNLLQGAWGLGSSVRVRSGLLGPCVVIVITATKSQQLSPSIIIQPYLSLR